MCECCSQGKKPVTIQLVQPDRADRPEGDDHGHDHHHGCAHGHHHHDHDHQPEQAD